MRAWRVLEPCCFGALAPGTALFGRVVLPLVESSGVLSLMLAVLVKEFSLCQGALSICCLVLFFPACFLPFS